MKIFKPSLVLVIVMAFLYISLTPQLMGCKKETITNTIKDTVYIKDTTYYDVVCPVRGTFTGTSTASSGAPTFLSYNFQDNNFAVGKAIAGGANVTFGGYRNTCDSVILSVYYTANSSYYLLKGKFSNNRNTISGTFNNLTIPTEFGTFTMSK